jgi:hypothetical protein
MEGTAFVNKENPTTPQSADTAGVGPAPYISGRLGFDDVLARLQSSDIKYVNLENSPSGRAEKLLNPLRKP